jgi:transcription elongation GreA/GreB family factor
VEVSLVRKRVQAAIAEARQDAQRRRQAASDAQRAYTTFLENVAAPLARQVANALKAEGLNFTVFTPGDGVKLASDRGRDDFIELSLDTESDRPQVIGRISRSRGSRTLAEERPIKPGVAPDALTEEEVLDFLVWGLAPWLER